MKSALRKFIRYLLVFNMSLGALSLAIAQTSANPPATSLGQRAGTTSPDPNEPWPRVITYQGATISVYQPQVESWTGNKLVARSTVKVKLPGKTATDYGVVWYSAQTEVDKVNRVVTLENIAVTKQSFPTIANNGQAYSSAFLSDTPKLKTVPLDLLEAELAVTNAASEQKTYPLENNPPQIIFSITPAVLALVDGAPVLRPSADNLQKVINTRAMILFDPSKSKYYIALMDGWMEADRVDGMYWPAKHAPTQDMEKILQAAQSNGQNQPLGNPQESLKEAEEDGQLPTIFVMTKPAELVVTQGLPVFAAIPGTGLQYVSNTGSDVSLDSSNQTYYLLIAGRWFQSGSLQTGGEWSYVAATSVPPDFAKIPSYSPKASVLVSVPGTPQAKEAIIANSVPQTATITRSAAKLNVTYDGSPDFQTIQGTRLTYAVNSATPVIFDPNNAYYAVENGVWFTAGAPTDPWVVATVVP